MSYARRCSVAVSLGASVSAAMSTSQAAAQQWKVFVTRRVPPTGIDLLKSGGCVVSQWNSDAPVPRDELIKGVGGCDALFCLLTDRIDKEVLNAAGTPVKNSRDARMKVNVWFFGLDRQNIY